jgi:nucleoid-associated protein YgaU
MSDRETESFTPYEPQTSYDWDYGEEPPKGGGNGGGIPNILWGRLVALGVLILLVFMIGRWSAPDGVSTDELRELRGQVDAAEEEVAELRAALAAQPAATPTPTPSVTIGDQTDEAEDPTFDGETYVVQSGDTMRGIAERFCGDPAKDDLIAEFNGIADPTIISVGAELMIPEDCGA